VKSVDERTVARVIELALLAALLVFLGVAALKLFDMLDRIGVPWVRGLPLAALFVAAAWLTHRRLRRVLIRIRNANDEGSSKPGDD
jgi:membrane protein implicated in regulation of membrane protease activity